MTGASSERWQAEVDSRLARLELRADEAELAGAGLGTRLSTKPTDEDEYPNLDSWVQGYFCATFSRPLGGEFRWCSQWQQHPEAVVRLDALWSSWKALHSDAALGISTWLQNFLDPQLVTLLGAKGPFATCSPTRHEGPLSLEGFESVKNEGSAGHI